MLTGAMFARYGSVSFAIYVLSKTIKIGYISLCGFVDHHQLSFDLKLFKNYQIINNVSTHYVTLSLKLLRQLALANREIAISMLKTSLSAALSTILTFDLQSSPQREAQELIEAVKLVEALSSRTKKIIDPINSYNKYEISDSEDDDDEDEGTEEGELISEETKKDEKADQEMTQEEYLMYQPLIEQLYPLCWKLLTAAPNSSLRISVIQVQVLNNNFNCINL